MLVLSILDVWSGSDGRILLRRNPFPGRRFRLRKAVFDRIRPDPMEQREPLWFPIAVLRRG